MSTKVREYKIKMPYTMADWRKGQRYVIAKYTTDEVQIIDVKRRKEQESVITETHKMLDISKRLPGIVKKVLSGTALCVDEYSTNVDVFTFPPSGASDKREVVVSEETLKNKDGLLDEMAVTEAKEVRDIPDKSPHSAYSSGDAPKHTRENSSTCETRYVNRYYDVSTFSLSVKTHVRREDEGNIFSLPEGFKSQVFDLTRGRTGDGVIVFKLVEVKINSTFFGWIAENIKNMLRDMLVKFQEKMIETEAEWKDMSEEELERLEEEMVRRLMKRE